MDEDEAAAPDLRRAAKGLEQGLETCQKIINDYRSKLLSIERTASASTDAAAGADTDT